MNARIQFNYLPKTVASNYEYAYRSVSSYNYFGHGTGRRVSRDSEVKFIWDRNGRLRPHDRLRFARTDMRLGTVAGPIGPREASVLSVELCRRSRL